MTGIHNVHQFSITFATNSWVDLKKSSTSHQIGFDEVLNLKNEAFINSNASVNGSKSLKVNSLEKRIDTDVILAQLLVSQKIHSNVGDRSIRSIKKYVNSVSFNESACKVYESIDSIFCNDMQVELIQSVCSKKIDSQNNVECKGNLKEFSQPPVCAMPVPVIYYLLWIAFEYISYKVPFSVSQGSKKRKVTSLKKQDLKETC
ncbi:hypothetical protein QMZ30_10680 [Pantoea sp. EA-12]|uniref:hypothetical protein n=1 Tax=Pantoea sp. EA-12 TaxID=3043303 RepID=UPI0024B48066|nr:hypothetical protein [Pantoea sp. EA-12]MDI9221364.1 hypothetical protein [Pantoea sp. EA-12]